MKQFLLSVVLLFAGSAVTPGRPANRSPQQDSLEAIQRWMSQQPGTQGGLILPVSDASVVQALPSEHFYALRYPRYPVARVLPEDLSYSNLLVVHADGNVARLADANALESLFRSRLIRITNGRLALQAVRAWLRLTQEFHQDGFFEFQKPSGKLNSRVKSRGIIASGSTTLVENGGNKGEIAVVLRFDPNGKLLSAVEMVNVISGRRPNS